MGLNAGKAAFMKWDDFEEEFYDAYPVMRQIIEGSFYHGCKFKIVKMAYPQSGEPDSFPSVREGTYGNLKHSDPAKKELSRRKRWTVKPRGDNVMHMDVEGYRLERRSNGGLYNVYIYPPNYIKSSAGERWIGAYVSGVDMGVAEHALRFAKDLIQKTVADDRVKTTIRKVNISKSTEDWIKSNPLLAARLGKTQDNLQPDFSAEEAKDSEVDESDAELSVEEMTLDDIKREIAQLESEDEEE